MEPTGAPGPDDGLTAMLPAPKITDSWSGEKGRFVPGTLIGGRFRIVALLGRGGMGEIYRAEDLRLDQSVALKFLTQQYAHDSGRLTRLLQEVRLAREITHPCVSRIYDFFDVDGFCFVSMEYVDGENLAGLLRRIGRLPQAKALEITHQILSGLAAAHEKGILHRDLKPENIMIDGRGQAHLMDFGIASLREGRPNLKDSGALVGTPAFMAPELLKGKSASEQSDLYALGVLLFELFTGQRPFLPRDFAECVRMHLEDVPPSPSSVVRDLDPAVNQAILRCLEKSPAQRPRTARALAADLPGGDLLANALAAGVTPAPEVVAEADVQEYSPHWLLWSVFLLTLAGIGAYAWLAPRATLMGYLPSARPALVLADRSAQILHETGWVSSDGTIQYQYVVHWVQLVRLVQQGGTAPQWDTLDQGDSILSFEYYRCRDPWRTSGWPENNVDRVILDHRGRLRFLSVTPWKTTEGFGPGPDWSVFFREAGLDISDFTVKSSVLLSAKPGDQRMSWTGNRIGSLTPLRVEATAHEGRPIRFAVSEEARALVLQDQAVDRQFRFSFLLSSVIYAIPLIIAMLMARVHLRSGRGDRHSAHRLAMVSFFAMLLASLLTTGKYFSFLRIIDSLSLILGPAVIYGAFTWVLYLAAEPTMRRYWPLSLVGWLRVLSGKWRDPLVGRDVLNGLCTGAIVASLLALLRVVPLPGGMLSLILFIPSSNSLLSMSGTMAVIIQNAVNSAAMGLGMLLAVVLVWRLVRLRWLAMLLVYLAVLLPYSIISGTSPLVFLAIHSVIFLLPMLLLRYSGLLAFVVFFFSMNILTWLVGTHDWDSWVGTHSLLTIGMLLGLTGWSFHQALGGRPVFGKAMLG